jgi:hypothetical protein
MEEWLQCPRRGWMRQNWNIDWAAIPSASAYAGKSRTDGEGEKMSPLMAGNYIHKIMELIDFNNNLDEVFKLISDLHLIYEHEAELRAIMAAYWQSPLPAQLKRYQKLYRERSFNLLLTERSFSLQLRGAVDLLAYDSAAPPLVVDYKVAAADWDKYAAQMACYALACWKGHPDRLLPHVKLCFLRPSQTTILEKSFTSEELYAWEDKLLQAGLAMAQAGDDLSLIPYSDSCDLKCQLYSLCRPTA